MAIKVRTDRLGMPPGALILSIQPKKITAINIKDLLTWIHLFRKTLAKQT